MAVADMCRLCMSETNVSVFLFENSLSETINSILPTKVRENDNLPNYICVECHLKIKIFMQFQDTVRNSDVKFKSLVLKQYYPTINNFGNNNGLQYKPHVRKQYYPTLPSTEDVIQNLLQTDGFTVKKTTRVITRQKINHTSKAIPLRNRPIESIEELKLKLLKSGVIMRKVLPKEAQDFGNTLYLPEHNACDIVGKDNILTDSDEDINDSSSEQGFDDLDEEYIPEKETIMKKILRPSKCSANIKSKNKIGTKREGPVVEIKTTSTFVCISCRHRFLSFNDLKDHMNTNDFCKNIKLTCESCGKVVKDRKAMYQHSLTHKEKQKFVCEECGKTYTNIFSMENHKAIMHGDAEELAGSVYKCKVCSETFAKRKDLFLHVNKHTKEQVHLCDTCGKCFSTEDNLRSHLRTHSDIRPYACGSCEKRFRTRLALVQHSHRHTGIKPFVCDVCGKTFAKKCSLTSHVRIHSGDIVMYQCYLCLEQFSSNGKLKTHIKFHPA